MQKFCSICSWHGAKRKISAAGQINNQQIFRNNKIKFEFHANQCIAFLILRPSHRKVSKDLQSSQLSAQNTEFTVH